MGDHLLALQGAVKVQSLAQQPQPHKVVSLTDPINDQDDPAVAALFHQWSAVAAQTVVVATSFFSANDSFAFCARAPPEQRDDSVCTLAV